MPYSLTSALRQSKNACTACFEAASGGEDGISFISHKRWGRSGLDIFSVSNNKAFTLQVDFWIWLCSLSTWTEPIFRVELGRQHKWRELFGLFSPTCGAERHCEFPLDAVDQQQVAGSPGDQGGQNTCGGKSQQHLRSLSQSHSLPDGTQSLSYLWPEWLARSSCGPLSAYPSPVIWSAQGPWASCCCWGWGCRGSRSTPGSLWWPRACCPCPRSPAAPVLVGKSEAKKIERKKNVFIFTVRSFVITFSGLSRNDQWDSHPPAFL